MVIRRAVVVGGGSVGCVLALLLRAQGVEVELAEARPDEGAAGSGILLHGNALRVLRAAGVAGAALGAGSEIGEIAIAAPDGRVLAVQQDLRSGGPDLPATLGIPRPRLQDILTGAVRAAGVRLRTGCRIVGVDQEDAAAEAYTADGTRLRADVVVVATGAHGGLRAAVGPGQPVPTGWGAWRTLVPRPAGVTGRTVLAYGGPAWIAGYAPMGPDLAYALLVTDVPAEAAARVPREKNAELMARTAAPYGGGVWQSIRDRLPDADAHFTPFETLLAERWYQGRVVLAGDAAHVFPPTLAQGAAMGLEDALVLAEVLTGRDTLPAALAEYQQRRLARVRPVRAASHRLAELLGLGRQDEAPPLIGRTLGALTAAP